MKESCKKLPGRWDFISCGSEQHMSRVLKKRIYYVSCEGNTEFRIENLILEI